MLFSQERNDYNIVLYIRLRKLDMFYNNVNILLHNCGINFNEIISLHITIK